MRNQSTLMSLSAGIVGLPNVGKSTLFNTITNSQVEAANYPFATIDPNVGVVQVPDKRIDVLGKMINPDKTTRALCTFVDIAGLVKGASKGEGLGNKFLSNIREVDAICHVVRCFDDKHITHVYDGVDPVRDVQIINLELIMADLETMEKRLSRVTGRAKSGDKMAMIEEELCLRIYHALKENKMAKTVSLTPEERKNISSYNLLTIKPTLFVANVNEGDIHNPKINHHFNQLKGYVEKEGNDQIIPVSINIEYEISVLSNEDRAEFMADLGIKETGLDKLVQATYHLLNLETYFTYGKVEVRAWTFKNGMTAPECAGIIHSDFERGFIKAEILSFDDLVHFGNEAKAKENGKLRMEGKNYIMKDGDICHFKFNV